MRRLADQTTAVANTVTVGTVKVTGKAIGKASDNSMPDLTVSIQASDPIPARHKAMGSVPAEKDTLSLRNEGSETIAAYRWSSLECQRRRKVCSRRGNRHHPNTAMRDRKCQRRLAARAEQGVRVVMVVPERIFRQ